VHRQIAGGRGDARAARSRVLRRGEVLFGGLMLWLKREHQDVDKAAKGFECGMIAEVWRCVSMCHCLPTDD
jgi:hypothetical protein